MASLMEARSATSCSAGTSPWARSADPPPRSPKEASASRRICPQLNSRSELAAKGWVADRRNCTNGKASSLSQPACSGRCRWTVAMAPGASRRGPMEGGNRSSPAYPCRPWRQKQYQAHTEPYGECIGASCPPFKCCVRLVGPTYYLFRRRLTTIREFLNPNNRSVPFQP